MAISTNPISAIIGYATEFFASPYGKVASIALAGVGTAVAADVAVQTGTAKNIATLAMRIGGLKAAPQIIPVLGPAPQVATPVAAPVVVKARTPKVGAAPAAPKPFDECLECRDFRNAVHATSVGLAAAIGAAAAELPPPNPDDAKYKPNNYKAFQSDFTTWQSKIAKLKQVAGLNVGESPAAEGAHNKGVVEARRMEAQASASSAILTKVQANYQGRIDKLSERVSAAKDDAGREALKAQIESLKGQQLAASATQKALSIDGTSAKSIAMQAAIIEAATKRPDDLTGMFGEIVKMKTMANMAAPPVAAAPAFTTPWSTPAQTATVTPVDNTTVNVISNNADINQVLQYSVSGSDESKDLEEALRISGIADDLEITDIGAFDADPTPCDTGCAT